MKIYIDESGTLPDPNDKVIILAAIVTDTNNEILKLVKSVKKRSKLRKPTGELKYYTASEKSKKIFFNKLLTLNLDIFALIVDKNHAKIEDSPSNFALLSWILIEDVFDYYKDAKHFIFDKHFSNKLDIEKFNSKLQSFCAFPLIIEHVDSSQNIIVNSADMIAGCILANETGKNMEYFEIIKKKILSIREINWKELKKKFYKKTCLNQCKHPSKQVNYCNNITKYTKKSIDISFKRGCLV